MGYRKYLSHINLVTSRVGWGSEIFENSSLIVSMAHTQFQFSNSSIQQFLDATSRCDAIQDDESILLGHFYTLVRNAYTRHSFEEDVPTFLCEYEGVK